jgi:hypothetical protein
MRRRYHRWHLPKGFSIAAVTLLVAGRLACAQQRQAERTERTLPVVELHLTRGSRHLISTQRVVAKPRCACGSVNRDGALVDDDRIGASPGPHFLSATPGRPNNAADRCPGYGLPCPERSVSVYCVGASSRLPLKRNFTTILSAG